MAFHEHKSLPLGMLLPLDVPLAVALPIWVGVGGGVEIYLVMAMANNTCVNVGR